MTPQQYAALCGASQFLSGPQFVSGYPYGGGSMGMADIAGWGQEIAGNADPVSALLGMDMSVGWNPVEALFNVPGQVYKGLTHLNPFDSNFFLRSHHAAHPAVQAAIQAKQLQHGAGVVDRANTKARKTVSPLVATVVGGGLNANIPSNPQTLFLPETFVIPASIAPSFTVQDIKVGNISQFPTTGDVPGEMFAQNAFNNGIRLDTVNPAINLSVAVTNITGGALTFRGGFYGTLVQ
jgi:hypothetical protein